MKKAIIYARFSPRRNADTCESNENQLGMCRVYCKDNNLKVVGTFCDSAVSGAANPTLQMVDGTAKVDLDANERPGLWEAIASMKKGMVLVVWRLDRIARDVFLSEVVHQTAARNKWEIRAVDGHTREDTPEQVLMRQILTAFFAYERKLIAARTKATMDAMERTGRLVRQPPYGYRVGREETITKPDGTTKVIRYREKDPFEQKVIRLILKLRKNGFSWYEVRDYLNRHGVKARGKKWHRNSLLRIMAALKKRGELPDYVS